jgi:hypothetical protein
MPTRRRRLVALFGIAILSTVVGSWLLAGQIRPTEPATDTVAGLSAALHTAGWLSMDAHTMDQQGGYQMPAQMMPGAPAGDQMRLGVPVTLRNTSGQPQRFNPAEEFALVGGVGGDPVLPHSDTFGQLTRLNPDSAVEGVLYFDTLVPTPTDPPLTLRWSRGGDTVSLTIPLGGGTTPAHDHGP